MGLGMHHSDEDEPDPFLLHDEPQNPPGPSDPLYQPLPEAFEPWAQDFQRYENSAGYGLTLEDTVMWEPWSWKVWNLGSNNPVIPLPMEEQQNGSIPMTPDLCPPEDHLGAIWEPKDKKGGVTAFEEADELSHLEPWALGYSTSTQVEVPSAPSCLDQCFEPWSMHLVPLEERSPIVPSIHEPQVQSTSGTPRVSCFQFLWSGVSALQASTFAYWKGLSESRWSQCAKDMSHSLVTQNSHESDALVSSSAQTVVTKFTTSPTVAHINSAREGPLQVPPVRSSGVCYYK